MPRECKAASCKERKAPGKELCYYHGKQKFLHNCSRRQSASGEEKEAWKEELDSLYATGKVAYNQSRTSSKRRLPGKVVSGPGAPSPSTRPNGLSSNASSSIEDPGRLCSLPRKPGELLTDFGDWLLSPDMEWKNKSSTRKTWLKLFDRFTTFAADQLRLKELSVGELASASLFDGFLQTLSENERLECASLFDKVELYRQSLYPEDSAAAVKRIKATASHQKRKRRKTKTSECNQVSTMIQDGKWPENGQQEYREKMVKGMMKFVEDRLPQIKKLNKGNKNVGEFSRGKDQSNELSLLAAYPVVMLDALGKPSRSKNKQVRTLDEVESMLEISKKDGIMVVNEEKSSCANDKTFFLLKDPRIPDALRTYRDHIRPLLGRKGMSAGNVRKRVLQSDLEAAHTYAEMDSDKFYLLAKKTADEYKKGDHKWLTIFKYFAPLQNDGSQRWSTKGLTARDLQVAYNSSEYQKALFLTPEGNPMVDFGLYFRKASLKFAGLHVGERLFRSIVTTEGHEKRSFCIQTYYHHDYFNDFLLNFKRLSSQQLFVCESE